MKWRKIHSESNGEGQTSTIPIEVTTREVKLLQNYLNKGKPLNDPSNKECMGVVLRILRDIVDNSDMENLELYVSNVIFEKFGIEVDIDPYGEATAIELAENGLIHLSNCNDDSLAIDGEFSDLVQGPFWSETTGKLEEGFMEVDDMNEVLAGMEFENGVKSIQLKKDGKVARLMLDFQ